MNTKMPVGAPKRYEYENKLYSEKAPKFVEHLSSFVAKIGKTTIIDCVIKSDSGHDIECEWFFEGKLITDNGRFRYLYEREDVVGLEIRQITVEDEGEYKCIATNKYGKAESKCEILVNVEGKIIDAPRDSTYEENHTAIFKCKYDGNPRPEVKWFLGKKEIKNGSKYNILNKNQVACLEIYDLTLDDGGTYSIVVSNDAGEDEFTFQLTVNPSKTPSSQKEGSTRPSTTSDMETNVQKYTKSKKRTKKLLDEREGIRHENPEKEYDIMKEIGRGKFSIVTECRCRRSGKSFAAKCIKYERGYPNMQFALNEYDLMTSGMMEHKGVPKLHEAWIVRKYLILVMDLCEGPTLLDHFANRPNFTEDDIANVIRQLCHVVVHLHTKDIIHMDIRPSNIRYSAGNVKLVDFNSARYNMRKMNTFVANIIGHLEFTAPEVIEHDTITSGVDMWSVAVIAYILCSGVSPFFQPTNDQTILAIKKVNWKFDAKVFRGITSEAKDFIRRCLIRVPEMRSSASEAAKHRWLSIDFARTRIASMVEVCEQMKIVNHRISLELNVVNLGTVTNIQTLSIVSTTSNKLMALRNNWQEEEQHMEASLVFRTFEEEEYISPEESD